MFSASVDNLKKTIFHVLILNILILWYIWNIVFLKLSEEAQDNAEQQLIIYGILLKIFLRVYVLIYYNNIYIYIDDNDIKYRFEMYL